MIVPMKHVTVVCTAAEGTKALETLRRLECIHVDLSAAASPDWAAAKGELADAEKAVRLLEQAARETRVRPGTPPSCRPDDSLEAVRKEHLAAAVLKADETRAGLTEQAEALQTTVRLYEPFGDFDPALATQIRQAGVPVVLAQGPGLPPARKVFFETPLPEGWVEIPLPAERLAETQKRLAQTQARIASITAALAAAYARADVITDCYPGLKDRVLFAAAQDALTTQGAVSYLEGWIPSDAVPRLRAQAVTHAWGMMLRDPKADETPPTLIRPPKWCRPVMVLFEGLGISPGYSESDVSVPFLCYFTLFFAMLVGDAGYGTLILALTLFGWRKTRPREAGRHRPVLVRSWLTLLTVFSLATIAWGTLSNAWFGMGLPFAGDWPTVKWLADPSYNNMMQLCFAIGVSHLMLARIWNGICQINRLTCLVEFGWAGVLLFMYFVVLAIVGIAPAVPGWSYGLFGVSLAMIVSKTRGIDLGMLPLNVMGAMGDIISYVRLFAVGYASLQVAQNFNAMAVGLNLPLWAKTVPMILILLVGHGINFMLAGLAILVHAVRLNTLEFSNHKGMTWSGYAFNPFRKH